MVNFSVYLKRRVFVMADPMSFFQPLGYPKRDKRESLPWWVDVQADLSLCWSHRSSCRHTGLIVGFVLDHFPYFFMKTYPENVYFYYIMKTYLHNFDPLKPHLYIVKLGFTGINIIFLISAQKHKLWVPIRTASPRQF